MNLMKCSAQAMALCDDRKACCSQRYPGEFVEGSECHKFNEEVGNKPLTNADRIRAMSDEELADFICNNTKCECCKFGDWTGCLVRDWLKEPVGVDE